MDSKTFAVFALVIASVNLAVAVAIPDGWMTPLSYGAALFCFGAAMLIAIEGCK